MKIKTSVSLSSELIEKLGELTAQGDRSEFIERVLWQYIASLDRTERDRADMQIINRISRRRGRTLSGILAAQKPL